MSDQDLGAVPEPKSGGRGINFKAILVVVLLTLVVVLIFQNKHVVTYNIFFWSGSMSLVILVVLMLVFGFLMGWLIGRGGGNKDA